MERSIGMIARGNDFDLNKFQLAKEFTAMRSQRNVRSGFFLLSLYIWFTMREGIFRLFHISTFYSFVVCVCEKMSFWRQSVNKTKKKNIVIQPREQHAQPSSRRYFPCAHIPTRISAKFSHTNTTPLFDWLIKIQMIYNITRYRFTVDSPINRCVFLDCVIGLVVGCSHR